MNDRYLFKAKRIDWQEWVEECQWFQGNLTNVGEMYYLVQCRNNSNELWIGEWVEIDPTTLCQCTGLKDKNGTLIWENDIVKDDKGNFYKVFWQNKYYQFSWICIKSNFFPIGAKWDLWSFKSYEIEVISSIFDNPELLEVE